MKAAWQHAAECAQLFLVADAAGSGTFDACSSVLVQCVLPGCMSVLSPALTQVNL
jgi:hypothetical protein